MENNKRLAAICNDAQAGLDRYMPTFLSYYNAYKALLDSNALKYLDSKGKSKNPHYYIMNKLQRINADFIEAYFTNKQFAKISEKPTLINQYYTSPAETIKKLQNAVDYYTSEDENSNLYDSLSFAFEDLQCYGTAAIKVSFSNGLYIEKIDIKDIKYDTGAKSVKDLKHLVHDIYMTEEDIISQINAGIFNEPFNLNDIRSEGNKAAKRFKLEEVYELKASKWVVSTIFNKSIVLRKDIELRFLPFAIGRIKNQKINPMGDDNAVRIYGDSIIAPLIPIQRAITITGNQQLDIIDRQLNPRYITSDKTINPFDFSNQKKHLIYGDISKIKEIPVPNIRDSIFNNDRLSMEGQEAIGVTDYNSGMSNNKQLNATATGISILTSESNKILGHLLRGCNETLIKPLFRMITDLVWAYGDAKFFYGIDRTQQLEYKVGVDVGLGATNKEMQLNSKMAAYKGMMELATMMQDPNRMKKAEKFYYKEILPLMGVENYEEYYQEEEVEQTGNQANVNSVEGQQNMELSSAGIGTNEERAY